MAKLVQAESRDRYLVAYSATQVLAESNTLADAAPRILEAVCESLGWQLGMLWVVERKAGILVCEEIWHAPSLNAAEFEKISRETAFPSGVGLPGRVWKSGRAPWIADIADTDFPLAPVAAKEGLHGAFAFPIVLKGKVLGVMEFLSREIRQPDEELLEMLAAIGGQIGQFIERKRAENQLQQRVEHLESIYHLSDAVSKAGTLEEIYALALDCLCSTLKADRASVLLYDSDGVMRFKAWRGLSDSYRKAVEGHSPWLPTAKDPQPVTIPDIEDDPDLEAWRPVILGEGIHALAFIPLVHQERLVGKLMIYYNAPHPFVEEEIRLVQMIGNHIAFAIERKRAEEALRESEERYRHIIETAEEGIWMIDVEGKTSFANSKMAEMLGYTVDEMAGQPVSAFIDDEWRAILKDKLAHRRRGERDRYDIKYRRKDGSELWAIVSTRPVLDENGKYVGALGMHTDISERKRMEEALRESEERLKRAMEASRVGTWEWDIKTGKVLWSESLELIHGIAPGTFGGTFEAFLSDVHPDDREWVAQAVGSSLKRGTHDIEYRILLADGSVRWVAGKGQVTRDEADQPLGMVGTCMDITESKQAEKEREELLTRERQARAQVEEAGRQISGILESITDGFVTLDKEWRYTYINREAEKILGRMKRKKEELIGKSIWEEFPESVGSRSYKEYHRAVAEQVTVEFEELYKSIGRWYGIRAYPSKDGLSVYTRDITERKQAENALEQLLISEKAARAEAEDIQRRLAFLSEASALLAAASPDMSMTLASIARLVVPQLADWCAIDVLDEDESIRRVALVHNEGSQVDLTQELEGRYPLDLEAPSSMLKVLRTGQSEFYPEIPDSLLATIARDAEHLEALRGLGFKSGMCVPLSARGRTFGAMTLISAESGRHHTQADLALAEVIARRAGLALDNARLYEELRKANEAKDEFLGLISHELRTPITAIYGGARMLRSRAERLDDESRTGLLTDIEQESERLYRMVEDLLALARVELGQEVTMEPVLAQRVIDKVAVAFKQRRPSRQLKRRIEKDIAPVAAEPVYLEQVLRNLLSNADKYSPVVFPIEIRAKRNGNHELAISVLDRGPGIAPEEADTIFERFYRSSRTSKQAKGAGMGLTVCKRLIEAQSGRIWAKPRKGGGLEIGFTLPLYEEVAA